MTPKIKITSRKEAVNVDPEITNKVDHKQIIRITEWSNERSKKDIGSWRASLSLAESPINPRRNMLIDLYEELRLDAHIIMLMNRYRRHITGKPFVLKDKKTGKADDGATKLLFKQWFFDALKYKSESKFFGHSLMQVKELEAGELKAIELIKRKFVIPEKGSYIETIGSMDLIPYRDDPQFAPYILEADNKDFGYLNPCAPHILFKRNAFVAWSEFCEVFGLPIRYVVTNNTRDVDTSRIRSALKGMAKSSYGIFHEGEELKFAETTRTDSFNVFYMLAKATNDEMSIMTLGETMTSDVGKNGSRAQAEVHKGTSDETAEENRRETTLWANETVLPMLNRNGYGLEKYEYAYAPELRFDKDQWTIYQGLLAEFDIDEATGVKFFTDQYGVPLKGIKAKEPAVDPGNPNPDPNPDPKENPDKETLKNILEAATKSDYHSIVTLHTEMNKMLAHMH